MHPAASMLAVGMIVLGCSGSPKPPEAPVLDAQIAPAQQVKNPTLPTARQGTKPNQKVAMTVSWMQMEPSQAPLLVAALEPLPEWYIYWSHPGEAGLPTRFRLKRQSQQLAHTTQMPLPKRMTSPGDIVSYGYEGKTHFFIDSDASRNGEDFTLRADWLACKEVCIKGQATIKLSAPPAQGRTPSKNAFKDWQYVPKPEAIKWTKTGPAWMLEMETSKRLELYPHEAFQLALDQTRPPYCKGNRCRIKLPPSAFEGNKSLAYTLRVESAGTAQGFTADFLKGTKP